MIKLLDERLDKILRVVAIVLTGVEMVVCKARRFGAMGNNALEMVDNNGASVEMVSLLEAAWLIENLQYLSTLFPDPALPWSQIMALSSFRFHSLKVVLSISQSPVVPTRFLR